MYTISSQAIEDIPVIKYNTVPIVCDYEVVYNGKTYDGFYISYNNYDSNIYGSDTTALVLSQMQEFFILNGNHIAEYKELQGKPFSKYLEYFYKNSDKINRFTTVK